MNGIKEIGRRYFVRPVAFFFIRLKIHPNAISISSLFFSFVACYFYRNGSFFAAAVFCFISGIFDTFDGEVARQQKSVSKIGAFLDSTIDRFNEFIVYLGMFGYYAGRAPFMITWIMLAVFGSMMVSYTRARAEGIGISPQVGIFERFTRMTLIIVGSVFGPVVMQYVIVVLAFGTVGTTLQRIIFVVLQFRTPRSP